MIGLLIVRRGLGTPNQNTEKRTGPALLIRGLAGFGAFMGSDAT